MQMHRELTGSTLLFSVARIAHIAQKLPRIYDVAFLELLRVGGKMGIIKIYVVDAPDTDSPAALFQPADALHRTV